MCVLQEEEEEDEISLSTTDSDEEEEEEEDLDDTASIATSIAELTSGAALLLVVSFYLLLPLAEISIKQQLVEQLERSQQSLQTLRTQYEEKMTVLLQQIKATESERDRVLKEIGKCDL